MPQDTGAARGRRSELLARDAFLALQNDPRYGYQRQILEVVHAEQNSPMDQAKKDLEIRLTRGGRIARLAVQVKSSWNNIRRHYRACRRMGGVYIPVMVVSPGETLDDVIAKAVRLIERAVTYLFGIVKRNPFQSPEYSPKSGRRHHRHWCHKPQRFAMVH